MIHLPPMRTERPLSALMGDSNDWTVRAVASLLTQNGFEVTRTVTAGHLVEEARLRQPDVIVLGSRLGELSGADACRVLRGMTTLSPATPVVMVTPALVTEEERVENLRAGLWDTIRLPMNAEELLLRIRRYVDAKLASDQAQQDRMVDPVTGFYNLRGLLRRAEEEASQAWRAKRPLACVVFGPTEETRSLLALNTDQALEVELSDDLVDRFRRLGRRSDVIGRKAPATFIVVANSTDEAGASRMARRILAGLVPFPLRAATGAGSSEASFCAGAFVPQPPPASAPNPAEWMARAAGAYQAAVRDPARRPLAVWRPGDARDDAILNEAEAGPREFAGVRAGSAQNGSHPSEG